MSVKRDSMYGLWERPDNKGSRAQIKIDQNLMLA